MSPELSVVILCYRSGDFAKIFHKKVSDLLRDRNVDYEIILVGNYRPNTGDNTPAVVKEIASGDSRTKAVVKEKTSEKQAMGWDLKSGLELTSGKIIAFIDGDGQMPPEDIIRLYDKMKEGGFDFCKVQRISRGDGPYRKFISKTFNTFMRTLFPGIKDDINAKPKIFTREVYNKLHLESPDWFIDAEIMIKVRRLNLKVGEVETDFYENTRRRSFISLKANFEFIKNIIYWRIKEFSNQQN